MQKNFKISSEQDTDCKGAEIQKDKEGKISGINFVAIDNKNEQYICYYI